LFSQVLFQPNFVLLASFHRGVDTVPTSCKDGRTTQHGKGEDLVFSTRWHPEAQIVRFFVKSRFHKWLDET
jgi:hypothetical protein